ncbi:hypothetical protein VOLCADRAFT_107495 [Volvox carteri f. nagariensis]|uniref:Inhibitor of growth protein N-terminal histone-binding domain-containing protein n=1 Tax=Volvox carteri f. nagariensis TaxID=3068 RepID=D8UEC5_VOLCA|nr:uncharacterized protein VOLCADRAFT_107495 [Volvox carteri f. nagariensis]EFJ41980.1 hypothetical protein VOLCADRAFT_107495 [Volvox carteri f. nagariensis]|eukprot:XP_002957017.1 hypothetical protein VOLCADRAFT_107495 [Volvox carteri f. nagariensis]
MALHNSANVMYLESFIESTGSLPTELQRILNTIKALDEKCNDLSSELQANVSVLLGMPHAHQQPAVSPEYEELVSRVAGAQKMLVQFAEEKVQLAQQAHDLLEVHALELERVTDDLDKELRRNNPDAGLEYLQDFALDTTRGKTPRLEDFNMSLQQELSLPPAPAPPPKKAAATQNVASKGKRPRDEDGVAGTGAVGGGAGGGGGQQAPVKKKAAVAAMQLSSQPSAFEDYPLDSLPAYEEPVAAEAPVPFMRPPPAGYKSSSSRPQAATGGLVRYLCPEDIREDLVGRHAELFWPDDNLWYLIEIQEVNVTTREARVLYSTGDFETLNLEETARDMHMVLIPDQLY